MTAGEIADLIQDQVFGDTEYPRDVIYKWMNFCIAKFLATTRYALTNFTRTTTAGTQEVALADSNIELSEVMINGVPLSRVDFAVEKQMEGYWYPFGGATVVPPTGRPFVYYTRYDTTQTLATDKPKKYIGFFPVPDQAYTVNLWGTLFPTMITSDIGIPPFPAEYHDYLVHEVLGKLLPKDGRLTEAQQHKIEAREILAAARTALTQKNRTEVRGSSYA